MPYLPVASKRKCTKHPTTTAGCHRSHAHSICVMRRGGRRADETDRTRTWGAGARVIVVVLEVGAASVVAVLTR